MGECYSAAEELMTYAILVFVSVSLGFLLSGCFSMGRDADLRARIGELETERDSLLVELENRCSENQMEWER
jgi:hypothetical protein